LTPFLMKKTFFSMLFYLTVIKENPTAHLTLLLPKKVKSCPHFTEQTPFCLSFLL